MHTKDELVKKKAKSEQLDLTETISTADNIAKKRLYLFIAIIITIGLSLVFWAYQTFRPYITNPKAIIPIFSLNLPPQNNSGSNIDLSQNLENQISQIITDDAHHWSISVGVGSTIFNWSKNKQNISSAEVDSLIHKLIVSKNASSRISPFLPSSLNIKENFSQNDSGFTIQSLILIPHYQLLFMISYQDVATFPPPHLPELISSLYWTSVQSLTN